MMTKKSEMAEWILDFFRRAKVDVGQVILMRNIQNKGYDYIYNPNAKLDCCYDVQKLSSAQSRYIANWHDSFVNWVKGVLDIIDVLSSMPKVTDEDR